MYPIKQKKIKIENNELTDVIGKWASSETESSWLATIDEEGERKFWQKCRKESDNFYFMSPIAEGDVIEFGYKSYTRNGNVAVNQKRTCRVVSVSSTEIVIETTFIPEGMRYIECEMWRPQDARKEAPKVEAHKVEAHKVEAPKVEAPKVEAPKVNIMKNAWKIATQAQKKFGGNKKDFFAQALKQAWADQKQKKFFHLEHVKIFGN